jgi:hypothetical protein
MAESVGHEWALAHGRLLVLLGIAHASIFVAAIWPRGGSNVAGYYPERLLRHAVKIARFDEFLPGLAICCHAAAFIPPFAGTHWANGRACSLQDW